MMITLLSSLCYQDILDLLNDWETHISGCSHIFLRVPIVNRSVLFQGKTPPFDKKDPRLRNIPFQTRRPTFKELQKVHQQLATVYIHSNPLFFMQLILYLSKFSDADAVIYDLISPKKPRKVFPAKDS
jgi:hypothetical protein